MPNPELGYPGGPFDPLGFSKVRRVLSNRSVQGQCCCLPQQVNG